MKQFFHCSLSVVASVVALSFAGNTMANDPFVAEAKQQVATATVKQLGMDQQQVQKVQRKEKYYFHCF